LGEGWIRWFAHDDGLRTPWRLALFVACFIFVLQLEVLVLPWLATVPVEEGRFSAGLVAQGALILAAAVLAGWVLLRWVDRRPAGSMGFGFHRGVPAELALGLAIGAASLAVPVALATAFGAYRVTPDGGSAAAWLAMAASGLAAFALPAAAEEALFRGYPFRALVDGPGPWVAVLLTSVAFALVHGANPNVTALGLLNIFLAGVLLAVAVLRTGSLWFASAVHLGWNWVVAGPLELPVSGLDAFDAPFYDTAPAGPAWISGGAFGPEGGLVATLGVATGLALVWWATRPGALLAPANEGRDERGDDR
jgi:membrane protease YdiL (CAAX protease family)